MSRDKAGAGAAAEAYVCTPQDGATSPTQSQAIYAHSEEHSAEFSEENTGKDKLREFVPLNSLIEIAFFARVELGSKGSLDLTSAKSSCNYPACPAAIPAAMDAIKP